MIVQCILNDMNSTHARFVDRMGEIAERDGLSRIAGRLFGALLISPAPRSLDDLAEQLGVSKASAAMVAESSVVERRRGEPHKYLIAFAVVLAALMQVIDSSIVNVALPDMMGNLGASLDEIAWVSTGYILASVVVIPLTGWLGDLLGRKRYFVGSIVLFTV